MALNIKNAEVERLATQLARMTGRTKTEAIRRALLVEVARQQPEATDREKRAQAAFRWLNEEIWPIYAPNGSNPPTTKAEVEEILGFGPHGV
ncbi:MAG: type II toxin-antitoxin system VapB family antitoxin [Acidobacteria bacterium]|nr:type II toxin-antitoxin system VapB family antitoxin [Acidobacteriota bacterium]